MRRPLFVLAAVAGLLLGSFGLWWWATARLASGFAAWSEAAAAAGWTVRTGSVRAGGWPLAATLVIADLSLAGGLADIPGGADWAGERVELRLSPLAPDELAVRVGGEQRLRLAASPTLRFSAERFAWRVPLAAAGPVSLDAKALRFGPPLAGMTVGLLTGSFTARAGARQGEPALVASLSAEAIALPPPPAPQAALGDRIASATLEATLDGPLPPASDPAARAAAWRQGGGIVQVRHFAIGWGPLGLSGNGTLGLDPALQPEGTASVRAVGYEATLARLADAGAMKRPAAQAVQALLGLLARAPEGGGSPVVELPLALHEQVLSVGRIPVGKIPTLVWPTAP
jgi:hypothetical protein